MRRDDRLRSDQLSSTAATVSPTTSPIQKPDAAIGSAGDYGIQRGARPSQQPSGSAKPQNASSWICIGWRETL